MKLLLRKKILYPIIGVLSFVLSFVMFVVNSPNAYADTTYTYTVSNINFKTASADGYFTISKANGSHDGSTGKISYYMAANSSLTFTFAPTNKIITSVSSFNFYGEYDIDDYGTMAAKSVTYSYSFGSYTSESTTTTNEYTFSVNQDQLNAQKPTSITFTIIASEILQLRVGGEFVFNAKDANVDISFNTQGGTGGTSTIKATPGSPMPAITLPTKTGYSFGGYYTGTNGSGTQYYTSTGASANNCPASGLTLYAKWTANKYTVNFDKQSGTGGSNSVTATYASAMPAMTKPTRTGYTFGGYYTGTNGGGTQYYNANGGSARNWDKTSTTTLYAKWTANTYTVNFDKQNGTGGSNSVTATYASAMPSITKPTRTGYTFGGYYTETNGGGTQYYNANGGSARNWDKTSTTTLYAKWTANTYTITFDNQSGTGGLSSVTATYDSAMTTLESLPTRQYYDFLGYFDAETDGTKYYNADGTSAKTWDKVADTTLYAQWQVTVEGTITFINDIGDVTYTPESKALIDAANTAYNSLSESNQLLVTNYDVLVQANTDYDKVDESVEKVAEIGVVEHTPTCKALIDDARTTYDALTQYQKDIYPEASLKTLVDDEKAYEAMGLIIDVTDVENTIPFRQKVTAARNYYDNLTADQKALVTNYNDLTDREAVVDFMDLSNMIIDVEDTEAFRNKVVDAREDYDDLTNTQKGLVPAEVLKVLTDDETIIPVMDKIDAIGDVTYTSGSKALIDDANAAYNNLAADQKDLVVNYDTLVQANTDYDKVDESVGKVNAIGEVVYTPECKALIDDARTTYDALTQYQKNIYPEASLKTLVDDEKAYEAMDKINAIGEIENTKACKDKIITAKNTFDALTDDQEALVAESFIKILNDDIAAFNVIEMINVSSKVEYTKESKAAIDSSKAAYNALTEDQKELVVNYNALVKAEIDYLAVDAVVKEINNIGDITCDEESNNKIISARESYDALTDDQKAFFPEEIKQSLIDYETTYVALEKIYAIGKVEYAHETGDKIRDARRTYNSLTPEQKSLINDDDFNILNGSAKKYNTMITAGIVWMVLLLLLSIIAIAFGIYFIFFLLGKKNDDDEEDEDNKPNTVKTMSVAPLGLIFLTSHLADGGFITLYVFASIAVLIWIAVLIIFILKKKGIIKASKINNDANNISEEKDITEDEEVSNDEETPLNNEGDQESEDLDNNEEETEASTKSEDEVITTTDEKGNTFQIRYNKSFTAKLSQAPDELKDYYNQIKNYVLSYRKTNSRISWQFDSINIGRNKVVKFAIRGKTLCVYYALDEVDSKYKVETTESKKYADVSKFYRIKNNRRCQYAKELVDILMRKLHIEKGKESNEDFKIPYEETNALIEKGLIKETKMKIK